MSAHLHTRLPAPAHTHSRVDARGALAARHFLTLALALLAAALLLLSRPASGVEVALSVNVAPPPLPVYEQPPLPSPGYIWVPGYWSYGPDGYFWVPATWVLPPDPDLLWTPGYWEFSDGMYVWNPGYWAPAVGFYGGIVYGFGYFGHGYDGGYWRDHQFYYNRTVNNIGNTSVTTVYNKTVNNVTVNNISYNGPGGVGARPTAEEQAAARQGRHAPTREQAAQATAASHQHELLASVNQGHPPIAATSQPGSFSGPGVVPARTAARGAPANAARSGHAPGATGSAAGASRASAGSREGSPPPSTEPPRRLAQAPPQTAPAPTHQAPGPAERATPPAQTRSSPEIGPNERPPAQRPPPPAERGPPEGASPDHVPPRAEAPQRENPPQPQSAREPPNGRAEDQPPH